MSSDAAVCANLSVDILRQNGSAVDAAITAMLCNGVVHAESSGLGGGGFMVVRLSNGSVYSLNFRETAPANANWNMFHSDYRLSRKVWVVASMNYSMLNIIFHFLLLTLFLIVTGWPCSGRAWRTQGNGGST